MQERHLNLKDVKLKLVMGRRIGASLNHWKRVCGAVESLKGPGQVLYWQLKPVDDGFDVGAMGCGSNRRVLPKP